MCGRVVARVLKAAWTKNGKIVIPPAFRPSCDIGPTSGIIVFRADMGTWDASFMRWGLIPYWWKDAAKLPGADLQCQSRDPPRREAKLPSIAQAAAVPYPC